VGTFARVAVLCVGGGAGGRAGGVVPELGPTVNACAPSFPRTPLLVCMESDILHQNL
jgi:hypothetical protein